MDNEIELDEGWPNNYDWDKFFNETQPKLKEIAEANSKHE